MAKFKISTNFPASLKKINKSVDWNKVLKALGLEAIRINRNRIVKLNQNVDGSMFKRYRREYLRRKVLSGRNPEPNLTLTGNLLKSMTILSIDLLEKIVIVGFSGSSSVTKFVPTAGKLVKGIYDSLVFKERKRKDWKATNFTISDTGKQVLNKVKAVGNQENGRDVIGLSQKDTTKLSQVLQRNIKRFIK